MTTWTRQLRHAPNHAEIQKGNSFEFKTRAIHWSSVLNGLRNFTFTHLFHKQIKICLLSQWNLILPLTIPTRSVFQLMKFVSSHQSQVASCYDPRAMVYTNGSCFRTEIESQHKDITLTYEEQTHIKVNSQFDIPIYISARNFQTGRGVSGSWAISSWTSITDLSHFKLLTFNVKNFHLGDFTEPSTHSLVRLQRSWTWLMTLYSRLHLLIFSSKLQTTDPVLYMYRPYWSQSPLDPACLLKHFSHFVNICKLNISIWYRV